MSTDRGRDAPDFFGVLAEDHELAIRLLLNNEPISQGKARLPEPDLLLPRGLFAASCVPPPFFAFLFRWGVVCCLLIYFLISPQPITFNK